MQYEHTDLSGPGNNGNEEVLYTPQISKTRDSVYCHAQDTYIFLWKGILLLVLAYS